MLAKRIDIIEDLKMKLNDPRSERVIGRDRAYNAINYVLSNRTRENGVFLNCFFWGGGRRITNGDK